MTLVPGLLDVPTMIYGNAIKPGAPRGFTPELFHFGEGFQKYIVSGVFRFSRISQKPEREIIDGAAVLRVKLAVPGA